MPYVITTHLPCICTEDDDPNDHRKDCPSWAGAERRTAVATPDEVRDRVHALGADYGVMAHLDCVLDGTSRMPVGPLPDGTVIEVQRVSLGELNRMTPEDRRDNPHRRPWDDRVASILAAFNTQ